MTKKQALSILQPEANTFGALKQAYRAASMKHHPDCGGDAEIMKLVNEAYEILNASDWTETETQEAGREVPLTETLKKMLLKVSHFPGIKAEIMGTWLWISGNTYDYKKEIKTAGFKFSKNKKSWYYHENAYRKFSKKKFSMNEIRYKYGSQELHTSATTALM